MGHAWLWAITFIQAAAGLSVEPLVRWSMEKHIGSTLLPDFGNEDSYSVDLTTFENNKHFEPGVIGDALILRSRKIKLIEDIWKSDCVRNPSKCKDGLTVSFWLKVMKRGIRPNQVIMRSSDEYGRRPGIYIGGDKKDASAMKFFVRTTEGKLYQASGPWTRVQKQWSHVALYWNVTVGIKIFMNGSQLQEEEYLSPPTVEEVLPSYPVKVDLIAGDILGPTFLLDDLWIFYHSLSDDDIFSLYELGASAIKIEETDSESPSTAIAVTEPNEIAEHSRLASSKPLNQPTTATREPQMTHHKNQSSVSSTAPTPSTSRTDNRSSPEVLKKAVTSMAVVPTVADQTNKADMATKSTPPQAPLVPKSPYNGWFYSQPWYHALLGITLGVLLAVSIWMCVAHCCVPSAKGDALGTTTEDTQALSLEPLVEK